MITRIEISGFKTFTDFVVDLAPFTVIAGANASGKSNLLDALNFVSDLANTRESISLKVRGGFSESFTKYSLIESASSIALAVEMLLPRHHDDGQLITPPNTRIRYELVLEKNEEEERFYLYTVEKEKIATIPTAEDSWIDSHLTEKERQRLVKSTIENQVIFYDKHSIDSEVSGGTYISTVRSSDDIHLRLVQSELRSIVPVNLLHWTNFEENGAIPADGFPKIRLLQELIHYKNRNESLDTISQRVRRIINDVCEVDVYTDMFNRSTIMSTDRLGRAFLANNLSEGTKRIIALSIMLIKTGRGSTVLLEEPENGVDPRVLNELLTLLLDLSTDFSDSTDLRQVICTTHSPTLLQEALNRQKNRNAIRVLLATKVTLLTTINGQRRKLPTTRMNEVVTSASEDNTAEPLTRYTLRQALDYLNRLQLPDDLLKALPDA